MKSPQIRVYSAFIMKITCPILILLTLLLLGCMDSAFYQPGQLNPLPEPPPGHLFFTSMDGTPLSARFLPATGHPIGTVIHFHGNYRDLEYNLRQSAWLQESGFNLFVFDYRGYGRSEGTPDRRGVYEDSVAAIAYVSAMTGPGTENIFLFGQSLGGANAIVALGKNRFPKVRAIAVEGAFSSYRGEARERMAVAVKENVGAVPCLSLQTGILSALLISDGLDPEEWVAQLSPTPLLVIHCENDQLVYPDHCRRLFARAEEPKQLWLLPDCDHVGIFGPGGVGMVHYRRALAGFFRGHGQ